jgi:glucosylceramidase
MAAFTPGQPDGTQSCLLGYCRDLVPPATADYRDEYVQYFVDFVRAYEARGVPIGALGIQNEPYAPANYPGGAFDDRDQLDFVGRLHRALRAGNAESPRLWAEFPPEVAVDALRAGPNAELVDGLSYHCYHVTPGGKERLFAALDRFHEEFPGASAHVTECTQDQFEHWDKTIDIAITHVRFGASSVANWNLALDPSGGPQSLTCGTLPPSECSSANDLGSAMSAPVVIDDAGGRARATLTREYYEMGHFSKFVRPGAVRIASTDLDGIENVAFENRNGTRVLVAHNRRSTPARFAVNVDLRRHLDVTLPGDGIATWTWDANGWPERVSS